MHLTLVNTAYLNRLTNQLENARAAMDQYLSHAAEWETGIRNGQWQYPVAVGVSTQQLSHYGL